jgi:RNA polymerase primary sigma factor
MGQIPCFSPEDEKELAERISRGDPEARSRMIRGGVRLVVDAAHEFPMPELRLLDVIDGGCRALANAVDRFDAARGISFRQFALPLIRQGIQQVLDGADSVDSRRKRSSVRMQTLQSMPEANVVFPAG